MTHEYNKLTHLHAPVMAPEDDYSLPDALDIMEYTNVEDSLASPLTEDLEP